MRIATLAGVLSLFALGLTLSLAAAADKGDKAKDLIVGKWTPTSDKEKGKFFIEFTKDGKLIRTKVENGKTTESKGTYKFTADGKVETEQVDSAGQKMKDTLTITVTKDELTAIDSKTRMDTFTRVK